MYAAFLCQTWEYREYIFSFGLFVEQNKEFKVTLGSGNVQNKGYMVICENNQQKFLANQVEQLEKEALHLINRFTENCV